MGAVDSVAILGWPLAVVLGLLLVGERLRWRRRREALNRAIHELRRPLQLMSLGPGSRRLASPSSPLELAIAALGQLDRELNGGRADQLRCVSIRELAHGAVSRWRPRARLGGGTIALRWRAGDVEVLADPSRIGQALDNLIANAIEHGGPNVVVEARASGPRLRISVVDDGCDAARSPGNDRQRALAVTRPGRRRRGHGLEVVRSVAAAHRGRFAIQRSAQGSVAMLELPLAGSGAALAA